MCAHLDFQIDTLEKKEGSGHPGDPETIAKKPAFLNIYSTGDWQTSMAYIILVNW